MKSQNTADFPCHSPYSTKRWADIQVVFPLKTWAVTETVATSAVGKREAGCAGSLGHSSQPQRLRAPRNITGDSPGLRTEVTGPCAPPPSPAHTSEKLGMCPEQRARCPRAPVLALHVSSWHGRCAAASPAWVWPRLAPSPPQAGDRLTRDATPASHTTKMITTNLASARLPPTSETAVNSRERSELGAFLGTTLGCARPVAPLCTSRLGSAVPGGGGSCTGPGGRAPSPWCASPALRESRLHRERGQTEAEALLLAEPPPAPRLGHIVSSPAGPGGRGAGEGQRAPQSALGAAPRRMTAPGRSSREARAQMRMSQVQEHVTGGRGHPGRVGFPGRGGATKEGRSYLEGGAMGGWEGQERGAHYLWRSAYLPWLW